jgi:predicted Zn-dependent protease
MESQSQLEKAEEALNNGNFEEARHILDEMVIKEPNNAQVWQLLFEVLENPLEKCDCLKNIVRIHPKDKRASLKLKKYSASKECREAKADIFFNKREREAEEKKRLHHKDSLKDFFTFLGQVISGSLLHRR